MNKNEWERIFTVSGSNVGLLGKSFSLFGMPVSVYVWTRFANYSRDLLVSKVIPSQRFVGITIA